ncbi:hypothetical protein NQD34_008917 [Periophthalmus magnuspinnatus]|uniref:F-actin-uncapping protein LRRC16A-like isoform X1 n=1 Tax=Periophthalmus magnuspinnatus TaxID=409849 RepID=UPI00145A946D|nr:F-actin-uncapping protein LRRC16A-like isoform X1 [Periophthalmus magnuspinnatus]KAJ0003819.1 hypothetical protein NQD34_008917 [Periophthalmus magnuspinnatus]
MEEKTEFPQVLLESVREALGRGVKVELKVQVQLEIKDKVENRVLVLAPHRLFLLTSRVPSKVEQSFSLLDLQGVSSNKPTQLVLEHDRGFWVLRSSVLDVDDIIAHIGLSLRKICPNYALPKLLKKLSLKPPERTEPLLERWENAPELGPCGGFSLQYWVMCDHLGLPYRDEVQWDVDTIYLTQDTKELNLQDFIHLENKDLIPIIAVLEHNQWFTKLSIKDYKLPADVCDQLLRVVARSSRLEELVLDNVALRSDFAQKLALALSHNPASALHSLTLCNNSLEDKGISALSSQLAKLPLGLKQLNLSRTGLSAKGVNSVCQALSSNPVVGSSLKKLDMSENSMRGDELQQLQSFLSQPNSLKTLDLSHSDCSLEQVCSSLLRGSLQHLSVLNLSKCVFSHRKSKEISSGFKLFFSSALSLSSVSLSGTKLPLDALKALLLGLGCNPNLSDVSLDLSGCDLRSGGSQILEGCIAEIPNITSLDISDNGLDMDLVTLLVWLSKNRSIRHLALGKNFSNIKTKNLSQVLDNLVHMIQEEDSPLSSLSLADSRLKAELSIILNALGSNSSLTKLDISGNAMGDMGAKMLAKALQINTKLRTILWDRNSVSAQGLQDVASALEKNYTIRFMPAPIIDAAQALKNNPEKTEDALLKMEQYLLRNHETRKYLQEQAYRLQQGIVTTTTQQMMDSVCVKVQDHLNSLRFCKSGAIQEDVRRAQSLMRDARHSKTLLPNLYHLQDSASRGPCVGAIQDTLGSMAGEVFQVLDQQLQSLLEQMVSSAQTLCPHVMQRSALRQELLLRGGQKKTISENFICSTLLEQSGVDIINKISEVKLNMASSMSDRIVDEILESLSQSQLTLAEHVRVKGHPLEQDRPLEPEVIEETELQQEADKQEEEVVLDTKHMDSNLMKSKRKSILVRMLRPVSVAFESEFDLDKALEEVPIHIEDLPPSSPVPTPSDKTATHHAGTPPPDLPPPAQVQTLEHHTKSRPKPKKRSKPTRAKRVVAPPPGAVDTEQSSLMEKLDEGIDEFFSKTVSKLSFKRPLVKSNSQDPEKKRKSGFFNYIKSRTSRSEKSHGSAAVSPPASSTVPAAAPSTTASASVPEEELSPVSPCPSLSPDQSPKTNHQMYRVLSHEEEQTEENHPNESEETRPETNPEARLETRPETTPETNPEIRPEPLRAPPFPRHMGVPVLGMGLMAEMKAKLAAQKSETKTKPEISEAERKNATADKPDAPPLTSTLKDIPDAPPAMSALKEKPDVSPPSDPEDSRPEPAPRSRVRSSSSTGLKSPTSPTSPTVSLQEEFPVPPLPTPRLKRVSSEQDCGVSVMSPVDSECVCGSAAFESPVTVGNVGVDGRPWSSLKRNQSLEAPEKEERERAKSLPDYVRSASLCGSDPGSEEEQSASCGSEEEEAHPETVES